MLWHGGRSRPAHIRSTPCWRGVGFVAPHGTSGRELTRRQRCSRPTRSHIRCAGSLQHCGCRPVCQPAEGVSDPGHSRHRAAQGLRPGALLHRRLKPHVERHCDGRLKPCPRARGGRSETRTRSPGEGAARRPVAAGRSRYEQRSAWAMRWRRDRLRLRRGSRARHLPAHNGTATETATQPPGGSEAALDPNSDGAGRLGTEFSVARAFCGWKRGHPRAVSCTSLGGRSSLASGRGAPARSRTSGRIAPRPAVSFHPGRCRHRVDCLRDSPRIETTQAPSVGSPGKPRRSAARQYAPADESAPAEAVNQDTSAGGRGR